MYRTPTTPHSSLRLLKTSPKLPQSARVILELASRQPDRPLTIREAVRLAGGTIKHGVDDVRALYQESERLGVVSLFNWGTDRATGEASVKMSPETAAMWRKV